MDESSSPQSNMEDRISDLPDSLIHKILSFVDMKYAVQTSLLSKRWQHIWKSLTILNFDVSQFTSSITGPFTKFTNFMYMVLLFRDDHRIQKFQLNFRQDRIDSSHIHKWIAKAVKHNVEELCFKSETWNGFSIFPHSLCTCKSLTKLELELPQHFEFGSEIVSTSVILPKLKSMDLQFRCLSDDNEDLASKLFTKCPALESLILDISSARPINLRISVPTLKHISLTGDTHTLSYNRVSKVTLCAPNLSSFICFTSLVENYRLENLSSLVTADVRINIAQDDKVNNTELREATKVSYARSMVELLRGMHNVKVLSLTNDFKVLAGAPEVLDCQLPEFANLQRLNLKTWLSRGCIDAIIYLLRKSPNLEFLELNIEPMDLDGKDTWDSAVSLPFMLHHLKHIVIRGLRGYSSNEVQFIKIMLESAVALEKVVLFGKFSEQDLRESWPWRKLSCRKKRAKKFKEALLAYPGASSIISFRADSK